MKKVFLFLIIPLIFLSGCISYPPEEKPTPNFSSNTTNETINVTTIMPNNVSTTPEPTPVVKKPVLNLTASMIKENIRWRELPIHVYIEKTGSYNCDLQRDEILEAIRIWESETVVSFKLTDNKSCTNCVYVKCFTETEANVTISGEYIYKTLGEAHPVYYQLDDFYLIDSGYIGVYRTSVKCIRPIKYIHEFGHMLGLAHSENENNVMHQYEECDQVITNEIKYTLEQLYSEFVDDYVEYLYNKKFS